MQYEDPHDPARASDELLRRARSLPQSEHDDLDPEARLVAHLFGELAPEDAQRLDAELEASPALAAERAALAAAAALIQRALPPESLSPELRASVLSAGADVPPSAHAPAKRPDAHAAAHRAGFTLLSPPMLRMVVGLAATGLGLLALRPWMVGPRVEPVGESARVDRLRSDGGSAALTPRREAGPTGSDRPSVAEGGTAIHSATVLEPPEETVPVDTVDLYEASRLLAWSRPGGTGGAEGELGLRDDLDTTTRLGTLGLGGGAAREEGSGRFRSFISGGWGGWPAGGEPPAPSELFLGLAGVTGTGASDLSLETLLVPAPSLDTGVTDVGVRFATTATARDGLSPESWQAMTEQLGYALQAGIGGGGDREEGLGLLWNDGAGAHTLIPSAGFRYEAQGSSDGRSESVPGSPVEPLSRLGYVQELGERMVVAEGAQAGPLERAPVESPSAGDKKEVVRVRLQRGEDGGERAGYGPEAHADADASAEGREGLDARAAEPAARQTSDPQAEASEELGERHAVRSDASDPRERLRGIGYAGDDAKEQDAEAHRAGEPAAREQAGPEAAAPEAARVEAERRAQAVELLHSRIVTGLEPAEGESAGQLFFRYWGDNPWVSVDEAALSTFAADVDTGSFGVVRRVLRAGRLPRPEQVRTEELVNWWRPDVPAPTDGSDFRVAWEAAPSRFGPRRPGPSAGGGAVTDHGEVALLRVAVRGRDVDRRARKPLALTLVVDVSGSMDDHGRIQLVRDAAKLLLRELSTTDSVALVTFGTEARTVVPMTSAANRGPFEDALDVLDPDGGTNVEAGLVAGYELAAAELTPGAVNRVVFLSDGVGNVGETDQARLLERVASERAQGIYLSTIGVGYGVDADEEYADDLLEQLADGGDGLYHNVNDAADAERYLVDQFTQSLEPIARDVKIQVEFDPSQVSAWRQLGYENRVLTAQQFRDDAVDGGELHAGHQVNALYEVRLRPGLSADTPLATARVRWKQPFAVDGGSTDAGDAADAEVADELEVGFSARDLAHAFADTSLGYRRAALVAQLAELLRRSENASGDSPAELLAEMEALAPFLADVDFDELLGLLRGARAPLQALAAELGPIDHKVDEIRRRQVALLRERERLAREAADEARVRRRAEIERLRGEIDRLEGELREALARELGPAPREAR